MENTKGTQVQWDAKGERLEACSSKRWQPVGHTAAGHGAVGPTQTALVGEAQTPDTRKFSVAGGGCQGSHKLQAGSA